MKKHLITATLVLLLSSGSFAQTLATINGTKIDSSEIERRAHIVQQQSQGKIADTPELRQYLLREMAVETIVAQEARRLRLNDTKAYKESLAEAQKEAKSRGEDKKADFKANWAAFENQLLGVAFSADVLKRNPVTEAQVQQRYNEIKARYNNTDEVQLGQIFTNQITQAQAAIKELNAKKSFAEVAKKYTIDPNVKAGESALSEYMSLVDLKEENPNIYQSIVNLQKGEFTKTPFVGTDMQAVFYINDKRKIIIDPFDKVKDSLLNNMQNERIQNAIDTLIEKAQIIPADK